MTADPHALLDLPRFGTGLGLHRVDALLTALDLHDVLHRTARVAITGTNGKGSTAKLTADVLRRMGRRVGLFTSPHLYRLHERIEVLGEPVSDDALTAAAGPVMAAVKRHELDHPHDRVGAFEALFVLAVRVFATAGCDALVLEAGIGGRYDPVRLARAPIAAVVSVDFDHTELLGKTLAAIALDKLEITASGGVVVFGPSLDPLAPQLRCHAALLPVTPLFLSAHATITWPGDGGERSLTVDGLTLPGLTLALAGRHQADNFAMAAMLARRLLEREGMLDDVAFEAALRGAAAEVRWPGRLEEVSVHPSVTVDVGHSPAAIDAALAGFAQRHALDRSVLVLGCSHDKDIAGMVARLAPRFPWVVCTRAHHRGAPAEAIEAQVRAVHPTATVERADTIEAAVARIRALCAAEPRAVYVAGGLFLAAEFAHAMRGEDPAALRFL